MSSLFARGVSFLAQTLNTADGRSVVYTDPNGNVIPLTAWVGRTLFAVNNPQAGAARVEWGERDYLIPVASLVLNGAQQVPIRGATITETINGVTMVFELRFPTVGEPCWRYSDQERTIFRVHTKRLS